MKFIILLSILLLAGCEQKDIDKISAAAKTLNDTALELKNGAKLLELDALRTQFEHFKKSLDINDLDTLKAHAQTIDTYLDSRIWGWYAAIYEANTVGGVQQAQEKITEFLGLADLKSYERDALNKIMTHLENNQGLQHSALLESIAVQSIRSKFGEDATTIAATLAALAFAACNYGAC